MFKKDQNIRHCLVFIIFILFIQQVQADPYKRTCDIFGQNCIYIPVSSPYYLCSVGTNTSLTIYATNPSTIGGCFSGSFQWYKLEWVYCEIEPGIYYQTWCPVAIDGETENGITITEAGKYFCTVDCGSGEYNTDTVRFYYHSSEPSISTQPVSQDKCLDLSVTFSCSASNVGTRNWWQLPPEGSWSSIDGATSSSYTVSATQDKDQYKYKIALTNGCGTTYSDIVTLDVMFPPSVTNQPDNTLICENGNTNFTTDATGDGLTYHWQVKPAGSASFTNTTEQPPYSNTNTKILNITKAVGSMDGNQYRCYISGTCSPADTTNPATLSLKFKPQLLTNPVSDTVCIGEETSFSVNASGYTPITYSWFKNGQPVAEQTGLYEYQIDSAVSSDAGDYYVKITNECDEIGDESSVAKLVVKSPPNIDNQTNPDPICEGEPSIQFSVSASGDNILYQWEISENNGSDWTTLANNATYAGATSSLLTIINPAGEMNAQLYRCRVEGDCYPADTSTEALLTVNVPPSIDTAPKPVTVCLGADFTLAVSASGTFPLYLWRKDGISITGWITSPTYTITGAGQSDAGSYDVLVKNICTDPSYIESDDATVTVNIPPSISSHPEDITLCEGSQPSVTFSTTVLGSGLSYLWEYSKDEGQNWTDLENNTIFSGVTTDELIISSTDDTLDQYLFKCKIIGICEPPVITDSARLTIKTAPEFVTHPEAAEICEGDEVTFTAEVTGTTPFQYRWMKGDASITNWTTDNSYTIFSATLGDIEKYKVLVKNECNTSGVASESAQLNVNPAPYISLGSDRHICTGKSTVIDAGSGYSSYNWSTGETSQSITVSDQGNYTVTVSDSKGCENSDNIYIILDPLLPGIDLGEDRKYCSGESVILDAGTGFDGYAWNDGSTGQTLSVYTTDTYHVTATRNNTVCISTDTVDIIVAEPYDQEEICLITIDLQSGRNLIIWEKTPGVGILAYNLYRQTNVIGVYELIGTVPYDNLSIFKDTVADPEKRQWVYKITAVDTCNNESDIKVSSYHRPLFLQYTGTDDGVNLEWESYVVEGQEMEFITYEIYRGSDSTALNKIDEISADLRVYKDINPVALNNKSFYRVAGVKADPCFPTGAAKADSGPYSHSMSNLEDNRLQTSLNKLFNEQNLTIFPNPFSERTTIRFPNPEGTLYTLRIMDITGKVVRIHEITGQSDFILNREDLENGYYIIELRGEKVFRGKIIIE